MGWILYLSELGPVGASEAVGRQVLDRVAGALLGGACRQQTNPSIRQATGFSPKMWRQVWWARTGRELGVGGLDGGAGVASDDGGLVLLVDAEDAVGHVEQLHLAHVGDVLEGLDLLHHLGRRGLVLKKRAEAGDTKKGRR